MSKKKSFAGSTMTLKDFHGGSIPSDFTLPSAPGGSARPPERPAVTWGPRGDPARARPGSAGGVGTGGSRAGLDDRVSSPFLSPHANVGRHFDEDERKPLDSGRWSASFDHSHPIPDSHPISAGPTVLHNAWAPPMHHHQQQHGTWSVPVQLDSSSKLVQASALEKIASGRWNSKHSSPDIEVINYQERESLDRMFSESDWVGNNSEKEKLRAAVSFNESREKSSVGVCSDIQPLDQERVSLPSVKGKKTVRFQFEDGQPASSEGSLGDLLDNQQAVEEISEHPKLKLFPRMKPLDTPDVPVFDDKKVEVRYLQLEPVNSVSVHVVQGTMVAPKLASAGDDAARQPVERPRLNLKPRSQPIRQADDNSERERSSVFGGARQENLVKNDLPKFEIEQPILPAVRPNERAEKFLPEQRSGRDFERRNCRLGHVKAEMCGSSQMNEQAETSASSWRNDQKNIREIEKPYVQCRPEHDSWRKPIEEPKPDLTGQRFGKPASPLELATAFSKSVSYNQRNTPGRSFSRLTDARELYPGRIQRQINGY